MRNFKLRDLRTNRVVIMLLILTVAVSVSAQQNEVELILPEYNLAAFVGVETAGESAAIQSITNNEFFLESLRLSKLAMETYEFGDYDASAGFAEEAIRFAQMSDEYVSTNLIAEARRLMTLADTNNIVVRFPINYNEGKNYYDAAVAAHEEEDWTASIDNAIKAIEIFAAFETGRPVEQTASAQRPATGALPRQYTVRTWRVERDCLWNIAGYPWVYNDPWRWPELYEANRSKMPDPNNPDWIEPGMILDIPSIQGETRQGMWEAQRRYDPVIRVRP